LSDDHLKTAGLWRELALAEERAGRRTAAGDAMVAAGAAMMLAGGPGPALLDLHIGFNLDSAASGDQANPYPLVLLGLVHQLLEEPDSARRYLERAVAYASRSQSILESGGSSLTREGTPPPIVSLGAALGQLANLQRLKGNLDSARALFERAAEVLGSSPWQFLEMRIVGSPRHIHLRYACAEVASRPSCEAENLPQTERLRREVGANRIVGDLAGEAAAIEALRRTSEAIGDRAGLLASDSLRAQLEGIGLAGRLAESRRLAVDSVEVLQEVARDHLRAGRVDSALVRLLSAARRLRDPLSENEALRQIRLAFAFAEVASAYHRRLRTPDYFRAGLYYDSAATAALNALALPMPDEQRTALSDRTSQLHADWAMSWLAQDSVIPFGLGRRRALGALEEGRARSLMLQRGEARQREYLSGEFRGAGDELGRYLSNSARDSESVLDYLLAGDTLVIWHLSRAGVQVHRQALDTTQLRIDIDIARRPPPGARSSLASRRRGGRVVTPFASTPAAATVRLFSALLPTAIRSLIAPGSRLAIVPDGILNEVPFGLLREDSTAEPLAVRNVLRFAPALSLLGDGSSSGERSLRSPCPAERVIHGCSIFTSPPAEIARYRRQWLASALIVGDPPLGSYRWADTGEPFAFNSLPGARAEAAAVGRALGAKPLVDTAATLRAVLARLPSASIVHLATHGIAYSDARYARRSFVALAKDRSGPGALEARELLDASDTTLRLRAELVVLSACQTALGSTTRSEGTVGLQRAFLARGARALIVSMWSVPDDATQLLMNAFYRAWLDPQTGGDKARALQAAQLAVRAVPAFRDPVYWAAFILVGES
jgi:tetratricopeptide (TPR) repeat protein